MALKEHPVSESAIFLARGKNTRRKGAERVIKKREEGEKKSDEIERE